MILEDIMTRKPVFATVETSLHDVAQIMADKDCGIVPVIENANRKVPVGVITDRDLVLRTMAHNKNPLHMIAAEVMTEQVVTLPGDASVEECIKVMENNQIRRVMIVDKNGELAGVVAQADIARNAPAFETAELVKDLSLKAVA